MIGPFRLRTMMPANLRRALAALALAAFALLPGCARDSVPGDATSPATAEPRRGGQVVVATASDMAGVNELVVPLTYINAEVVRQLFLPLVDEAPDWETLRPRLAESWEYSEDRRTLTFTLREGVVWSDGVPVTAHDVVFTYQAWTSPEVGWEGAFAFEAVERVEALDDRRVAFHFTQPYATSIYDVATGAVILPRHVWGELPFTEWRGAGDWFREHLVVNGPFDLASWTPQQEIVLERNPRYYEEGLPYLDRVVLRVVPDQTSMLTQLLGGQVDFVWQLSPDDVPRVEQAPDVELTTYWTRGYVAIGWNNARAPFDDARVRRALALGIDRPSLVESIWGRWARPIASPIPPNTWAFGEEDEPLPYDPGAARRLLEAAGWVDGDGDGVREKGGRPLSFRLATNTGNRQREDALVVMQDQLRRVGVDVRPESLEFHTLVEQLTAGTFDAAVLSWGIPTTFDFRYAYHSSQIPGSNMVRYADPEVDRLLEEAREVPELKDMRPHLDRLKAIQRDEQPYTYLWQSQRLHGVRRRLHDAEPNHLFTLYNLREWWVDPEPG
jgi:peptide/nickel transport system substrate-binding protein